MIDEYKQIPLIKYESGNMCPLCHSALTTACGNVRIYKQHEYGKTTASIVYSKAYSAKLKYCNKCGIHYATNVMLTKIREENPDFAVYGFYVADLPNLTREAAIRNVTVQCAKAPALAPKSNDNVVHYLKNKPTPVFKRSKSAKKARALRKANAAKRETQEKKPEKLYKGFRVYPLKYIMTNTVIHISNYTFKHCPICGIELRESDIQIPVSETEGVNYRVKTCGVHYFSFPSLKRKNLLEDNSFASGIKTDFTYYFKLLSDALAKYSSCNKHEIMMLIKNKKGTERIMVIVSHTGSYSDIAYLDYHKEYVRDILTNVIKFKKSTITVDGSEYTALVIGSSCILNEVQISEGGGYKYSKNPGEIVDVLLYSPYTGRYEITRASYDNHDDLYYMDIGIYVNFVKEYGNPEIVPTFTNIVKSTGSKYSDMNAESLLYSFGYNVSKSNDLSDTDRQSILAMVIDLNLMAQRDIVRFINWLISSHPSEKYADAREKWNRDRDYVMKYNANPERFIIAPDNYKV